MLHGLIAFPIAFEERRDIWMAKERKMSGGPQAVAATSPVEGASLCIRRKYCEDCGRMYPVTDSTARTISSAIYEKCIFGGR